MGLQSKLADLAHLTLNKKVNVKGLPAALSSPGKHADSPNTPDGLAPPCSHVHSHVIEMSTRSSGSIWPTRPIKLSVTCWTLKRNYTLSSVQMAELMVKYTYQAADGEQWVNMCLGCFHTSPLNSWGPNMCSYSEK